MEVEAWEFGNLLPREAARTKTLSLRQRGPRWQSRERPKKGQLDDR